jgi:hypothetical protein
LSRNEILEALSRQFPDLHPVEKRDPGSKIATKPAPVKPLAPEPVGEILLLVKQNVQRERGERGVKIATKSSG